MQEIVDWLEKLGMSEYAQRFSENGIDLSVLCDLSDQDLKDIGVLLGHRRKPLRAIAEHGKTSAAAAPASLPRRTRRRRLPRRFRKPPESVGV